MYYQKLEISMEKKEVEKKRAKCNKKFEPYLKDE